MSLASKITSLAQAIGADIKSLTAALAGKQDTLVSGTNIKKINGQSLLGAGDRLVAARSLFPLLDKVSDEPTADLLTQRMQAHEKTAWMLRSLLAK